MTKSPRPHARGIFKVKESIQFRRISIHLTSIDQEVHIAVQLAIYHVHTFFSVLFFSVYLIINALLYQKWARLSTTQPTEIQQYCIDHDV